MRMLSVAVALGAVLAGTGVATAEDAKTANTFSGIKLVDMKARTPEQTVTVTVGSEHVRVIDPTAKKDVKVFPLAGLSVTHTESNAPPVAAGSPESAQVGRGAAPTYMGKEERNWLTLKSGEEQAVLRVSSKVYTKFKAALEAHNVKIEDAKP